MTRHALWIGAVAILAGGCGGDESQSQLTVLLTDAPGPMEKVPITIESIEVQLQAQQQQRQQASGEGQWVRVMEQQQTHDLLQLQNGKTARLGEAAIPAGNYHRIRMRVSRVEVVQEGLTHQAQLGTAAAGIELAYAFQAREGEGHELVLDLDAAKSLIHDGSGYQFQPALTAQFRNMEQTCAAGQCP